MSGDHCPVQVDFSLHARSLSIVVRARQRREIRQVSQTRELHKRAGRDQQVMSVVLNEATLQMPLERAVNWRNAK
jgi:hypothetical protein